ncbi:MAG: hypothetical protein H6563_04510 [Lewinellaceae bacterium]|nr:hypothetical protein [Lewinellaceae bacterium]
MGKKKFKDGLESLFRDAQEEAKNTPLVVETEQAPEKPSGRSSGKHFSDELEQFFQEALQESIQDGLSTPKAANPDPAPATRRPAKPKDGLDALIRRTIESSEMDLRYDENRKRIAFSFEKENLEKLKKIARLEKTLLKDMIARVVADYIREYEQNNKL